MILEEELEIFSDDEINIEVPKSPTSPNNAGEHGHANLKSFTESNKQELECANITDKIHASHNQSTELESKADDGNDDLKIKPKTLESNDNLLVDDRLTFAIEKQQPSSKVSTVESEKQHGHKTEIQTIANIVTDVPQHSNDKFRETDDVTAKIIQPDVKYSQTTSSTTESVVIGKFETESLLSNTQSITDETRDESNEKQDYSFSSEDIHWDEISVTDEVFTETIENVLKVDAEVDQDTKIVKEKNNVAAAHAKETNITDVSIRAMKVATVERLPNNIDSTHASLQTNVGFEGNFDTIVDHALKESNEVTVSKNEENITEKEKNSKHSKGNGVSILKDDCHSIRRQSLNDIDSCTAQSSNVARKLSNEERGVSASNVVIDTEFQSPIPYNNIKCYDNNDNVTERPQRSCCHHAGNYRKIKLEGRRRQRLSIDGIHEVKAETTEERIEQADSKGSKSSAMIEGDQTASFKVDTHIKQSAVGENLNATNDQYEHCDTENITNNSVKAENLKGIYGREIKNGRVRSSDKTHCITTNESKTYKFRPRSAPVLRKRAKMLNILTINNADHSETVSMYSVDKTGKCSQLSSNCTTNNENKSTLVENNTPITDHTSVKNINAFHTEMMALHNASLSKEQNLEQSKEQLHEGAEHRMSVTMNTDEYSLKVYGSQTESTSKITPNQMNHDTKIACRTDGDETEMAGNEVSVSDGNQNAINARKQALHDGAMSRHCVDGSHSAVIVSCTDMDYKFDTKSFLLPVVNETGNCESKASAEDVIEIDSNSHYSQTKQLSLRANGKENNEIHRPKHSIVHTQKTLSKRATYADLYGKNALATSFVRAPLLGHCTKSRLSLNNETLVSQKNVNSVDVEKYQSCVNLESKTDIENKPQNHLKVINDNANRQKDRNMNTHLARTMTRDRNMSAGIRRPIHSIERTESSSSSQSIRAASSLTDTARLRSIRKWLKLPDDNSDVTSDSKKDEAKLIIQQIIDGVLKTVLQRSKTMYQSVIYTHRCTLTDEEGDVVLGCLLQTSVGGVDTSSFTCDVIDPLDVPPVTRKHEHLISNIVKISSKYGKLGVAIPELMVNIPISHWYVEPWQEVIVRQQDNNGHWKDTGSCVDIVKIDDIGKVLYGVRHIISTLCSLAIISRPKTTTVALEENDTTSSTVTDNRVKMHTFASVVEKEISLQVIPVSQKNLEEFQAYAEEKKLVVVASSPLIIVDVKDNEPESLAFDVPYVTNHPIQDSTVNVKKRPSSQRQHESTAQNGMLTPNWNQSPLQSKLGLKMTSPLLQNDPNQLLFHLVQLDDDDNVRIKLLENTDTTNDVTSVADSNSASIDSSRETCEENCTVNFSLYDRYARIIALETKGAILYSDVQNVTKPFVNFIVKHRVKVKMQQDPRNVYSILLTAFVEHPHREEKFSLQQTYANFTSVTQKEILIYEGDVVAIAFRGNVDVPDSEKLIYSFHGCRGVRRHFDIRVANPARQRSLQTYHGALQIFTLKTPRYSALDKSLAPCEKNGWELSAEFPLLLPKYLKTTPVIINKAPVSLKFQEPLTLDFVRALCSELSTDWSRFAKALGMGHARIQALKQHHKNQVSDTVVMDVVINWMKTQTISQDKVSPVINALRLCNKWKLASELTHRFSAQRLRRSRVVRDKHFQKVFSLVGQNKTAKSKWQRILQNLCSEDGGNVDDVITNIDGNYNDDNSKCLDALNHWKATVDKPSVWTLVDALRASDCRIVADTLVALEIKRN